MSSATFQNVRPEVTGTSHDETVSHRHRHHYGYNCPAVDVDHLLIEYDHGRPVALIEHKRKSAPLVPSDHPSMQAIRAIADAYGIPFLYARYNERFTYRVTPMNDHAREYVPETATLSEQDYVSMLYRLRGRKLPEDVREHLEEVAR
jgi:hypothetical protein